MTVNGIQENDSKIQNEEHQHDALAKRAMLVDVNGTAISPTNQLPVSATFTGTLEVHLNKDDDSVTVYQSTASNLNAQIVGTVGATILGGTLSATVLGGTLTVSQGTVPWVVVDTVSNSLAPSTYDYISLSYTGGNLSRVVFRMGGTSGTIISTLSLSYDGSNNLTDVVKG